MAQGRFVSYLRVSTERQGRSGLGLEAQREAVSAFLSAGQGALVAEVVEVESGGRNDRPKLAEALRLCRLHNATLVIAKLDRLSRDAAFLLTLESNLKRMGLRFVAADMPDANELTIHIMAVVAQAERQMISTRTKAALQAAKARGTKLGGDRGNIGQIRAAGVAASVARRVEKAAQRAEDLGPLVVELHASGASLRAIAADLNSKGIPTTKGGLWGPVQVARVLARVASVGSAAGA
ncbi:Resolvase domain [Methylobacterium sp. 4-46]|uniref:recombinase family protein n=1 Tax=unclassified Methylobacterium TaxID=2615210 RepID=UPI000152BFEB|nr:MULTISPECIES: recombinase family protein [Methylobacterium]ACA19285.1 Resolvase domain [Methylobacterium sp. 4-46]WFT78486.1 recombinase family protein [Methylobacterium nodulans]